jgi:cyclopropane-fatty-acyl-phospholipid synthase
MDAYSEDGLSPGVSEPGTRKAFGSRRTARRGSRKGVVAAASMYLLWRSLRRVIHRGTLTVIAPDGCRYAMGSGLPGVAFRITDWAVVPRLLVHSDLAVGEAYMDGTLVMEEGGIYDLLDLCLGNLSWSYGYWLRRVAASLRRLGRRLAQHNPVGVARANVAHHYDLEDTLYESFLDPDRQYSCAYFLAPTDTLERAQEQKKRHIAAKLLLRPGQRVLDIGSGWGGLALHLAGIAGVDVTGVTLSSEQHAYAQRRAQETGVADRVRFFLRDYRREGGRYDRIVSVGMLEHVGVGYYGQYFEKIRDLLSDDGIALIHTIGRADGPGSTNPWLRKYIFPGGYSPALSEVLPAIEHAGLYVTDVEVLRLHYAETLKAWRQRFVVNRERLPTAYDDRFRRMWEFYLAGCEATFRHSGHVNFQIQLSKRIDAVPLTRDYIAQTERSLANDADRRSVVTNSAR